ncbi:MAG: GntR family transcriptional regulator, partial [Geminicoccaceae bacterium]
EGFLTLSPGQGFYCRSLRPEKITELYQVRCALETEAVIRAIETASDADLSSLSGHLDETEATYFTSDDSTELARMDEEFHIELALRSGNQELVSLLTNVNERIRYVRIVNLRQLRMQDDRNEPKGLTAHRLITQAVIDRDRETAMSLLRSHIERRSEEVVELVKLAYSELYVPQP